MGRATSYGGDGGTGRVSGLGSLISTREEIRAFAAFPCGLWRRIWSNNPAELLNREIRRLTESSTSFPTAARSYAWSAP